VLGFLEQKGLEKLRKKWGSVFETLSWHLPGVTTENNENVGQDIRCRSRDSNSQNFKIRFYIYIYIYIYIYHPLKGKRLFGDVSYFNLATLGTKTALDDNGDDDREFL